MIVAAIENFVIFHTALSVMAFLVIAAIRAGSWWGMAPNPRSLSRAYTAALVVPAVTSAWLVTAALLPAAWLRNASDAESHHLPTDSVHLIQELTTRFEPFLGYAVVAMISVTFAIAMISTLRSQRRTAWAIRRLRVADPQTSDPDKVRMVETAARRHGIDVTVLGSDRPISFVTGIGRSTVAVSTGTLRALNAEGARPSAGASRPRSWRPRATVTFLTLCVRGRRGTPGTYDDLTVFTMRR